MNGLRAVVLTTLLAALVAALAAGCGAQPADPAPDPADPPTVTVVQPRHADATRTITLPGDVAGRYESALYAKVTGYLTSISVDKGDWVHRGQVLAEIEVPELQQKLKRARALLEVRRVTAERLDGVWKTDHRLVAREDVDIADGELQEAKADVEELEAMVGYTKIVAPFDGVITARYVDPGALIQASGGHETSDGAGSPGKGSGLPVLRIADIGTLRVYVYMPEAETGVVRQGQPATLTLREFPGRVFTGTVTRFATALDLSTRTMLTEVDLANPDHALYPGMYADVTLELERHPGAVQVPVGALGGRPGDRFVWVVEGGALAKRAVSTGLTGEGWVEVTRGLAGAEDLVATPDPGLRDGERVRSVASAPESRASAG